MVVVEDAELVGRKGRSRRSRSYSTFPDRRDGSPHPGRASSSCSTPGCKPRNGQCHGLTNDAASEQFPSDASETLLLRIAVAVLFIRVPGLEQQLSYAVMHQVLDVHYVVLQFVPMERW